MNNFDDKIEHYKLLRGRWDAEDNLLMSRTGVFLTANSIFCAASQLQQDLAFKIGVTVLSLIISFLWLATSWHSFNVIAYLYRTTKDYTPEGIQHIFRIKPVVMRPNTVFGKLLPIVIILAWIVYFFWCLRNLIFWGLPVSFLLLLVLGIIILFAEKHTRKLRSAELSDRDEPAPPTAHP